MKRTRGEEHGCLDAGSMIGAEDDDDGIYEGEVYEWPEVARCHLRKGKAKKWKQIERRARNWLLGSVIVEDCLA